MSSFPFSNPRDESDEDIPWVHVLDNSFVMWNYKTARRFYGGGRFFGKPIGARKVQPEGVELPHHYSYYEVVYLKKLGEIRVGNGEKEMTLEEVRELCRANFERFDYNFTIYEHLRNLGYVVRPGMKFGAEFLVYKTGPGIDHAEYVVHILYSSEQIGSSDIVKAGRLAGTVRKIFLLAYIDHNGDVKFFQLDRVKI